MNKLKVGDRVRVYGNASNGYQLHRTICTVVDTCQDVNILSRGFIEVKYDGGFHTVHPRQCAKIKSQKKVTITRKDLKRAWNDVLTFDEICKLLGL